MYIRLALVLPLLARLYWLLFWGIHTLLPSAVSGALSSAALHSFKVGNGLQSRALGIALCPGQCLSLESAQGTDPVCKTASRQDPGVRAGLSHQQGKSPSFARRCERCDCPVSTQNAPLRATLLGVVLVCTHQGHCLGSFRELSKDLGT